MLVLELAQVTDRGGRRYNEDACGHWQSSRQLCCVVADGVGGHGGGDFAARLAVRELIGRFSEAPSDRGEELAALLRETNRELIAQRVAGTPRQDMHSTVVCLVIDFVAHGAHWAHAGDSRLYWFRDGRVLERTRDHSVVQTLVDAGALAPEQARRHPKRGELHSALGLAEAGLKVSAGDATGPVQPGDAFLLCTDGLWEPVDDGELERLLAAAHKPRHWLQLLDDAVRRNVGRKAKHDNYSALAVWARASAADG